MAMTTIKLTTIKALALTILLLTLVSARAAHAQPPRSGTQNSGYMTQTFVDTTILRAFYVLNATSSQYTPGSNRQQHAINQAKKILENLKQSAKGDPNERYALMKMQEVEAQIFLEEEELRRIQADRNILVANKLVIDYNAEVAKPRPDFQAMRGLFLRMAEVDTRQANRLADSYNKRHRSIAQEAQHSLEKALNAKDYALAKRELEYLDKNKNYLLISSAQLDRQRARLNSLSGAHTDVPKIVAELDAGERAYSEFKLSESRTSLTMAQNRVREVRGNLPQKEADALTVRAGRAIRLLDAREDSLVRVALGVLDVQGPDAAIDYFQEVLQRRMQLSQERSAIVDQAILTARPELALKLESKVAMVEVEENRGSGQESFSLIQDRARFRAQERADSIKVVKGRAKSISDNIYTLLGQRKTKDAERLFSREKVFLVSVLDKIDYDILDNSVRHGTNLSGPDGDKNRERAQIYMTRIYKLIEDNNTREASARFKKYRKPLQKYLDIESFKMLEITVTHSARQRS